MYLQCRICGQASLVRPDEKQGEWRNQNIEPQESVVLSYCPLHQKERALGNLGTYFYGKKEQRP